MHKGEPGLPQGHGGPGASGSSGMFLRVCTEMGVIPRGAYGKRGVMGVPGQPWKFRWILRGR